MELFSEWLPVPKQSHPQARPCGLPSASLCSVPYGSLASLASYLGTWMQNVGGVWLMTSLTSSSLLVSLMQTATTLPVFLVGLPAGALADIVDRRRLLLLTQGLMLAAAMALSICTLLGIANPWLLLGLTFLLGLGAAMTGPAWQAITPELVGRSQLSQAIALNSIGFSLSRAVGPAIGGLVVAAAGPGAVFLLNALSFVGVMVVLYTWRRPRTHSLLPPEHIGEAIEAGLRYTHYAPSLQAVLVHVGAFIACGSALWALLPLIARQELGLEALGYGVLLGCLGVGAVVGGVLLPTFQRWLSMDRLAIAMTLVFALATLALAYIRSLPWLYLALTVGGLAWPVLLSSLTVSVQTVVPAWVQARALAVYGLVFQGGLALGSALWGIVAERTGSPTALMYAAVGLVVGGLATTRWHLNANQDLDLSPSLHWSEPTTVMELAPEDGPVLITVEYQIEPEHSQEFVQAMQQVGLSRRRDGAIRWGLYRDPANPSRHVETFVVKSWAEHLRQHERVTVADRLAEEQARAFHIGKESPIVLHLIYAHPKQDLQS
ncbi:MFS transporter [Leptolyngbya sp. FACHB-261]|uniref:MFS transporter n=1 Tax=Leptolyngbya sp. FACHB-261 TaxID=2692806 RepID=UPI002410E72F|nr:MFS transporter [Leptolyngbya sp. FACHB-261]